MLDTADRTSRRKVPRTKTTVPELPVRLVSRPRLLSCLDGGADTRVTLVSAPAGYGKTLLLADWVRRRCPNNTAWVALDSDDNDERRFWSAVLAALAACPAVPEGTPLRAMAVPEHPSTDPRFLTDVVAAVDELPTTVRLVLDNVHELTDGKTLRGLTALLRHRLCGLRITVASRQRPPLSLARLRLAGDLTELRAEDLKFSPLEAGELLIAADVGLASDERRQLVECTEGWAAGLGLAANALRRTHDSTQLLADFAEHYRPMTEYLVHEVLSQLPDDTRDFLRTVSVCGLMSEDLAVTLSGRQDAGALLDMLARDSVLVSDVRVRDRWFHVWAPVRSQLVADLNRQTPRQAAELHARAADWFAAHDEPALATDHAGQAGDTARIVDLLHRHGMTLTLCGQHATVRRAIDALDGTVVRDDGTLSLVAALTELEHGDVAAADSYLGHAKKVTAPTDLLRRVVRSCRAQTTDDDADMAPAADSLAAVADSPLLRTLAALHRGRAMLTAGNMTSAAVQLRHALADARSHGLDYVASACLVALARFAATSGDLRTMHAHASQAYRDQLAHGWSGTLGGAAARVLLGYDAMLKADLSECARHAVHAQPVLDAAPADHGLSLTAACLRGTAEFGTGEWTAGLHRIRSARLAIDPTGVTALQNALCAVLEHRATLLLGMRIASREVLDWAESYLPDCVELMVMRARGQLVLRRHDSAEHAIRPALDGQIRSLLPWSAIDTWLVDTEIALQVGDAARANRGLARAITLAESSDVVYPLVFAAPEVIELLVTRLGTFGRTERRAEQVLTARRSLRASPVPLTERERAVLCLLPTLRSFEEIAADLTVSVNTVKTHVRAIYTKLGVGKRRDAVLAAVTQGLFDAIDVAPDTGHPPHRHGAVG